MKEKTGKDQKKKISNKKMRSFRWVFLLLSGRERGAAVKWFGVPTRDLYSNQVLQELYMIRRDWET